MPKETRTQRIPEIIRETVTEDLQLELNPEERWIKDYDWAWAMGVNPLEYRVVPSEVDEDAVIEYRIEAIDYHPVPPDSDPVTYAPKIKRAKLTVTKWAPVQKRLEFNAPQ